MFGFWTAFVILIYDEVCFYEIRFVGWGRTTDFPAGVAHGGAPLLPIFKHFFSRATTKVHQVCFAGRYDLYELFLKELEFWSNPPENLVLAPPGQSCVCHCAGIFPCQLPQCGRHHF